MTGTDDNPFPEPVEIEITDSFDLHSFSPKDIRAVLEAYLDEAHIKGFKIVRIFADDFVGVYVARYTSPSYAHALSSSRSPG